MEGAGGKQHPIGRHLPRKRLEAAGHTIRENFSRRSDGYRSVLGPNLAFVAWALGSDLGNGRLIILGYPVTNHSDLCFAVAGQRHFFDQLPDF